MASSLPNTGAPAAGGTGAGIGGQGATTTGGGGDALDKGISGLLKKGGHAQSNSTVEKISDGVRSIFKKVTGKDVPVKDQNYS
ncbi:hypothetical protein JCM10450v2_002063 [Rhodotorula kratochvilovae]